ncbi:MAG: hypothetical protein H6512_05685 [Acidimicrobiia bacterium]|nr:hypothetical protein [Acidimicrobiia bacterium]
MNPRDLDAKVGIDTAELFAFIRATQGDEWEKVRKSHSTADEAQRAFVDRLAKELDRRGTVDVLRHGLTYAGPREGRVPPRLLPTGVGSEPGAGAPLSGEPVDRDAAGPL